MAWTVLFLRPTAYHWNTIQDGMIATMERINSIVHATDPSLVPISFDVKTMIEEALMGVALAQHHDLFIHPDLALIYDTEDEYGWPNLCAGMTATQAVHFKLAHSDDYDIEVLRDREGEG